MDLTPQIARTLALCNHFRDEHDTICSGTGATDRYMPTAWGILAAPGSGVADDFPGDGPTAHPAREVGSATAINEEATIYRLVRALWSDESGQDVVEYVLVLLLLSLAALTAMNVLGSDVNDAFQNASDQVRKATGGE